MNGFQRILFLGIPLFLVTAAPACPPNDRGVIVHRPGALAGYTLVNVFELDTEVMVGHSDLIDMEGNLVKRWPYVGFPSKLLPGGILISGEGLGVYVGSSSDTARVLEVGWDETETWSFSDWATTETGERVARHHHDFEREGNPVGYYAPGLDFTVGGKTLVLAHKTEEIPEITDVPFADDVIYEVTADGRLTGFTWHASDHYAEFFDEEALQAIHERPFYYPGAEMGDLLHINSLSELGPNRWFDAGDERFAPENLIIGSRHACFVAIIERASGRVVWQIGPDFAEGPEAKLGQFLGQHHPHMIPAGLPGAGNILVFDNGGECGYGGPNGYPKYRRRHYSRVVEFDPVTLEIVWAYGEGEGERFSSPYIGGVQRLPNGNTLIVEGNLYGDGQNGRVFEVTPEKEIVWSYRTAPQGVIRAPIYRAYRIPPEWVPGNPAGYPAWSDRF